MLNPRRRAASSKSCFSSGATRIFISSPLRGGACLRGALAVFRGI